MLYEQNSIVYSDNYFSCVQCDTCNNERNVKFTLYKCVELKLLTFFILRMGMSKFYNKNLFAESMFIIKTHSIYQLETDRWYRELPTNHDDIKSESEAYGHEVATVIPLVPKQSQNNKSKW